MASPATAFANANKVETTQAAITIASTMAVTAAIGESQVSQVCPCPYTLHRTLPIQIRLSRAASLVATHAAPLQPV